MFDPDLTEAIPKSEITAINASAAGAYIQSVEVKREYTDSTQASAQLIWERQPESLLSFQFNCSSCGGSGCEVCSMVYQDACFSIKDAENGVIAPAVAATYDSEDGRWEKACPTECREPDQVKIWYYCGDYSQEWLRGEVCDALDDTMARTIAYLAVSRLQATPRAKSGLSEIIDYWRRDTAESWPDGSTIFIPPDVQSNPFGTRRGEVRAYKTLMKLRDRKLGVGVVA